MEETNITVTAVDEMNKIQSILDQYTDRIGVSIKDFNKKEIVAKILNMSHEDILKLHPDECAEYAFILSTYGLYVQSQVNVEKSRITWCKAQLRKHATPRMRRFSVGSFNHNFDMAVLDDDYTRKIQSIQDFAQQRIDRLDSMSYSLKAICDDIKNLERAKRSR